MTQSSANRSFEREQREYSRAAKASDVNEAEKSDNSSSSSSSSINSTTYWCDCFSTIKATEGRQGQHLHTLECRSQPYRLAVLDSSATLHTVAVTLPFSFSIDILEVGVNNMKVKRTLRTSQKYFAVAAVNNHTLAVWCGSTIDLIDLGGQFLRQICYSVDPRYMNITEDGYLMCSTSKNSIARVEVGTGTVVFHKSVPQIKDPCGVTITLDGSILVTDRDNNTLHLVSSQGVWMKQLWSVPSDGGRGESSLALGAHQGSIFHITYNISALTNPEIWTVLKSPAKRNAFKVTVIQSYMGKSAVVIA
ncbi:hypothetical protein PoB_004404500 [Plakobranchus ocellatus]|uniref:Uncharacterized protein n=1 Tax=Plakobranchus ocellatus TaxID=259542 RepID=A0AAV4BDB9_9GAST|nr:hypothetical protein PoB_004404500 [Plakobranchus ocellatus]